MVIGGFATGWFFLLAHRGTESRRSGTIRSVRGGVRLGRVSAYRLGGLRSSAVLRLSYRDRCYVSLYPLPTTAAGSAASVVSALGLVGDGGAGQVVRTMSAR